MDKSDQKVNALDERRQFFRVKDTVTLSFQPVTPDSLPSRLEFLEKEIDSSFTVVSSMAAITQQMAGVLHKIESEEPEVALYLKALDRKLDLLGRAFLSQTSDLSQQPAIPVDLSASGMAFHTKGRLEPGSLLELRLLLLPTFTGILSFAEVVGCESDESDPNYPYVARVKFSHMRDNDRDVLIRHVIKRQSEQLRRERESKEG